MSNREASGISANGRVECARVTQVGARFALECMCVSRNVAVCYSRHSRVRLLHEMSPRAGRENALERVKEGRAGGD